MTAPRIGWIALVAALLIGAAAVAEDVLYASGQKVDAPKLKDLDGREVSLADLKDNIVFVNFFSLR